MKKIAIVSSQKWAYKIKEDLFLKEQLSNYGIDAEIISWEDTDIDYKKYDCLIIRSIWEYQEKYNEFKAWLNMLKSSNIKIFNTIDIITNNILKDRQFKILDDNGIPHIPTKFKKTDLDIFENNETFVVKPIISGSGSNTFLVVAQAEMTKNQINSSDTYAIYKNIIAEEDNGIMIQPFVKNIENGEYACVFIDGENTHNMLRYPGIFSEKKSPKHLANIPIDVAELAKKVSNISEYSGYLYMRVDIIIYKDIPIIMEVELCDPDLMIKYIEDDELRLHVIDKFAKTISKRL